MISKNEVSQKERRKKLFKKILKILTTMVLNNGKPVVQRMKFENGGKTLVLQGMRHVAPKDFFNKIQAQINEGERNGALVLFEGVKGPFEEEKMTEDEIKIFETLKTIVGLYPVLASIVGEELQKSLLVYPDKAINVDVSMDELIKRLNDNNFLSNEIVEALEDVTGEKILAKINPLVRFAIKKVMQNAQLEDLVTEHIEEVDMSLFPTINQWRSEKAIEMFFEIVKKESDRNEFIMIYGNGHLKEMKNLLVKYRWNIIEILSIPIY